MRVIGGMEKVVRRGDLNQVKRLIRSGVNVNERIGGGVSLLLAAIEEGYQDIALLLLAAGADVHAKDEDGLSALHWACRKGLEEMVKVLTDRGSQVNERDKMGRTPLMLVGELNNKAILRCLLRAGATCKELSKVQVDDLFLHACRDGDVFVVAALLKNGCSISILSEEERNKLLHHACREGSVLVVEHLLAAGCNVNHVGFDGYTPIIVNKQDLHGYTPLSLAARYGNRVISMHLLRAGASSDGLSNEQMNGLYRHAFNECDLLSIQTLLKNGLRLSQDDEEQLLHMACHAGDTLVLEAVITNRCDVNCADAYGLTPLMVAAREGHEEVVKKLILAGAKVDMQEAKGHTALHIAGIHNHIQCGILLAEGGASVRTKNKVSQTSLDLASKHFKEAINQALSFTTRKALCIIGNAEGGKSTLVAALQAESNSVLGKVMNRFKKVSDRRQRTAGIEIIPHGSQRYGEVLFFDFAGQHEYHGPHQMFLESLLSKPGVSMTLLLVVKTTEMEEAILHQLHRWLSPVALMATAASPPQVIVIGSFLDKAKFKQEAIAKLTRCLEATKKDLEELPLMFVGSCFLNCRQPQSEGIDQLCSFLQEIPIPEFRAAHTQYSLAWVLSQIRSSFTAQAVQLQDFSTWIQEYKINLPQTMPSPEEVCWDLSAAGHALYLPNMENPPQSWLVLNIPSILHNVYGTLFSQYKQIANEFGLLHFQHLAKLFSHLDLDLVQQLLISLEFCLPVDPSVLKVEVSKLTQSEEASGWLFFPALIAAKPPEPTSADLPQQSAQYLCWQLRTSKKHFISARLLQTILLRLAAHFVVRQHDEEGVQQHCCSIWWNGIAWQSKKGVDITVHVTNNRVIHVVSKDISLADRLCHYLIDVICDILSTVRRLSPNLEAGAFIVYPPITMTSFEDITTLSSKELFPVDGVQCSIRDCEEYCFSLKDSNNPATRAAISDLFGGFTPTLEDTERINWAQPHPNQLQSSTGPHQPVSSQTDILSLAVYSEFDSLQFSIPTIYLHTYLMLFSAITCTLWEIMLYSLEL